MLLKRSEIPGPVLRSELFLLESLGGEVTVRGVTLSERLDISRRSEVETYSIISRTLAVSVEADDGLPLFTEAQWEAFGAGNLEACVDLFNVSRRLSGMGSEGEEAIEKK